MQLMQLKHVAQKWAAVLRMPTCEKDKNQSTAIDREDSAVICSMTGL
jgi:hypothetical protein